MGYQGINTFCLIDFFCVLDAFLSHGNTVGVTIWGNIWGDNIYLGDEF